MMIRKYFEVSWRITKDNIFVFMQIAILLSLAISGLMILPVIGFLVSIAAILLLPTLVTGLEGIYLKAIQGEPVSVKDVIYGRKKIIPLIKVGMLIVIDTLVTSLLYGLVSYLFLFAFNYITETTGSVAIAAVGMFVEVFIALGYFVVIYWRESQFIYAPNLIVEKDFTASDAMRNSKRLVKNRISASFLVFCYNIALALLFMSIVFSRYSSFFDLFDFHYSVSIIGLWISLILFSFVTGANAVAYAADVDGIDLTEYYSTIKTRIPIGNKVLLWSLPVLFIGAILVSIVPKVTFRIDENEQAILKNRMPYLPDSVISEAGRYYKKPWEDIIIFKKGIIENNFIPEIYKTLDDSLITVDRLIKWRIVEPFIFHQSLRSEAQAIQRLDDISYSFIRRLYSQCNYSEITDDKLEEFSDSLHINLQEAFESYGVVFESIVIY